MEELKKTIFSELIFPEAAEVELQGNTLLVKKWNWDYEDCLNFQKRSQDLIRQNKDYKIYIFCNHPHCFTLGRGNERGRDDLVSFDTTLISFLKFPVHKIHRGGGITFHYPGQWIFYPIVAINKSYTLDDHMCWLLKSVKNVLKEDFGIEKAMTAKKLMGVWVERQKIASIGVGLNRFVTEHGLALNLIYDEEMFNEVKKTNPCGMSPTTYICANQLIETDAKIIDQFHSTFTKSLH